MAAAFLLLNFLATTTEQAIVIDVKLLKVVFYYVVPRPNEWMFSFNSQTMWEMIRMVFEF